MSLKETEMSFRDFFSIDKDESLQSVNRSDDRLSSLNLTLWIVAMEKAGVKVSVYDVVSAQNAEDLFNLL